MGKVSDRSNRRAMGSNAAFAIRTPRSYVAVISRIKGGIFRQVIVPAHRKACSIECSNVPFQCCSKRPQHRVIAGLDGFGAAGIAATREVADLDFGLGIDGDSQRVRFGGAGAGVLDVLEDRVRFGNFFRAGF